jgi:hypothetical protein
MPGNALRGNALPRRKRAAVSRRSVKERNRRIGRASPAASLTRTGGPKVFPASRLTAAKTSVAPPGTVAPQATTTVSPAAAIDGVVFARFGTARSTVGPLACITSPRETARTKPAVAVRE